MNYFYQKIKTPVGPLHLVSDERHLLTLAYEENWLLLKKYFLEMKQASSPVLEQVQTQLHAYFAGTLSRFQVPIRFAHGTEFQKKVWKSLAKIPYGETFSYQEHAQKLGMPTAIRAVANANGLNPISIILPCHRVIGKSGKLTGYVGGLEAKAFLLKTEGIET